MVEVILSLINIADSHSHADELVDNALKEVEGKQGPSEASKHTENL